MIPFNKPCFTGDEEHIVVEAINNNKLSGDGPFSHKCHKWFEQELSAKKVLLTPSCTAALEMAALLIDIQPEDEVIMPSFTFVSSANAFVLRGAKIVFVDIEPQTMNINASLIEKAITDKTKAIVPVHYGGVGCNMDLIMNLAHKYNLFVIEDAAQGMTSTYKGKPLGTIGHIGAYSFHETKNYTSGGEGGLLIINDDRFIKRSLILREKGTNRTEFMEGKVDKYTWIDIGSSYLPTELQAAYLYAQLKKSQIILQKRLFLWETYHRELKILEKISMIELPLFPKNHEHNAHIFFIKLSSSNIRTEIIEYLKKHNIHTTTHYIPLHSSPAGKKYSHFNGTDTFTTRESLKILRLPMYFQLKEEEVLYITNIIKKYFLENNE